MAAMHLHTGWRILNCLDNLSKVTDPVIDCTVSFYKLITYLLFDGGGVGPALGISLRLNCCLIQWLYILT